jgi:trimethyllysine dioxygenase
MVSSDYLVSIVFIAHDLGGFYDFTSDLTMKDTAYTSLALAAHTDTAYFTDPARLQMFHLLSHTEGSGGKSLLVDGWKAADILREEDPKSWETLSQKELRWHSRGNEGVIVTSRTTSPIIHRHGDSVQIRWNNDDRATLKRDVSHDSSSSIARWYEAARKFDAILKRKDMEYWAQLEPGRPLSKVS